jgi:hypothetical protein
MSKVYLSTAEESSPTTIIQNGESRDQSATLAGPSPLQQYSREDLEDDSIQIEFPDEVELSLDDIADAVTLTDDDTILLDSEPRDVPDDNEPLVLSDPDEKQDKDEDENNDPDTAIEWDDEAFPWPTIKPISAVELHIWQKYALSPPPLQGADTPPLCFTLSSLVEWHATVESLISSATDLSLKTLEESEEDAAEQAYCILKTVKNMFRDLDTLIDVAWKVLENTQVAP